MTNQNWTIERVKDELPDVPVMGARWNPMRVVKWKVRGRQLEFARVFDPLTGASVEVSWGTLVRTLNEGRALML